MYTSSIDNIYILYILYPVFNKSLQSFPVFLFFSVVCCALTIVFPTLTFSLSLASPAPILGDVFRWIQKGATGEARIHKFTLLVN